ncbi:MAG: TetR/AcrR family transcriptional regulator [Thermodesulfobacteriota bacterium]|nr:TetR/AcrR family transcriptional regulator [Thermodesulfobacteriota bacterium]
MTRKSAVEAAAPALSPSARRRMREKEERHETILRAAEHLFVTQGYHHTSVENVADRAEVSVGTVYFYFKNKEDILLQLFSEGVHALRAVLGRAFQEADTPEAGFEAAGLAFFEVFCIDHPEKVAIVFKESVGQSRMLEAARRDTLEKLTRDVHTALMAVSEYRGLSFKNSHSARVVTVGILGIYQRVAYQYLMWADNDAPGELATIGRDAVDFIMGGLSQFKPDAVS